MRIVLLGDSRLAYAQPYLRMLGDRVLNAAFGGATVDDLPAQASAARPAADDVVVVSVGTNDAALAALGDLAADDFGRRAAALLASLPVRGRVVMTTPGVDRARVVGLPEQVDAILQRYADALAAAAQETGSIVVRTPDVLAPLGPRAFVDDGVHLTEDAYHLLLPMLREVVGELAGKTQS